MGQTTIIIMILTIISKIFGFVRESVMAAFIGAGDLKSIYTTAITIPAMLTSVVSTGIVFGYIPIYNRVKNDKGKESANEFTSNLINILMIYGSVIFMIIFIFAGPISKILSPNLTGQSLELSINYIRIIIFAIFALLYSSILRGYLNIYNNFIDPALIGIIFNFIIVIATIATGIIKNPYILIFGALFANIIQFIRFPFVSRKLGFKYSKKIDFSDKYAKSLLIIVVPIIISSAADQLSLIIDNSMASAFFGVSSISKIFYAKTMLNFIMGVVTFSVTTVTFPEIAKLGQSGKLKEIKEKTGSIVVLSMLLVIPATLGMMALSNPIIKLVFERNAFTQSDSQIVAGLLVSYAPYIIFASLIKILSNGFYSVGDSKTPVIIILIQQVVNVIMNVLLSKVFGIDGLAYATSISTAVASGLLVFAFIRKFAGFGSNKNIKSLIKIVLVSIIMYIVAKISYVYFSNGLSFFISLVLSVALAGLVYIVGIILSKIPELDEILKIARDKVKNKRK